MDECSPWEELREQHLARLTRRRLMPPHHRAPRARITFSDSAAKQLETITSEAQLHALDRALVVISVDPDLGEPISDEANGPQLHQFTDDIEQVRILYFDTAPRPSWSSPTPRSSLRSTVPGRGEGGATSARRSSQRARQ